MEWYAFFDNTDPVEVFLNCSEIEVGQHVIEIDKLSTKFRRLNESPCDDSATCSFEDDCVDGCSATVVVEYPNLFGSWQQACDGRKSCSFQVLPAYMDNVCDCDASEPSLAGCISVSYDCINVSGT